MKKYMCWHDILQIQVFTTKTTVLWSMRWDNTKNLCLDENLDFSLLMRIYFTEHLVIFHLYKPQMVMVFTQQGSKSLNHGVITDHVIQDRFKIVF